MVLNFTLDSDFSTKRELYFCLNAVSVTSVVCCMLRLKDIQAYVGVSGEFPYPIIADPDRAIAKKLGMIDPDETDTQGMPLTCRAVSVVSSVCLICDGKGRPRGVKFC
jgi:hypothetical protein